MSRCPYCETAYRQYTIVGVLPASKHLTYWLDPIPVAQLCCERCGRFTFMHPDHPDVQRLPKGQHYEHSAENVRTLNVDLAEVGDPELRHQFESGRQDAD